MRNFTEKYIDHEIRVRLLEKTVSDIKRLGQGLIATIIIGVALPITLHSFGLI